MTPRLEVRASLRTGGFRLEVDFATEAASTVLFGPSGAGKTLLLSILAGQIAADAGRAAVEGRELFNLDAGTFLPPERRGVGLVSQSPRLFPHLSVAENLLYGLGRRRGRPVRLAFEEVVGALDLAPLLRRRPGGLSGGEAQRVALGRALLAQPRLLLMDEPLASLDRERRQEILPFIERGVGLLESPLLYVTHDLEEARRLGDSVIRLDRGRVAGAAAPSEALAGAGGFGGAVISGRVIAARTPDRCDVAALGEVFRARGTAESGAEVRLFVATQAGVLLRGTAESLSRPNLLSGVVEGLIDGEDRGEPLSLRLRLRGGVLDIPLEPDAAATLRPVLGETLSLALPLADAAPARTGTSQG